MKPIKFKTTVTNLPADIYTPVGIYLRLRDKYRDSILLESADYASAENSRSIIGINAIAGLEINNLQKAEIKMPGEPQENINIAKEDAEDILFQFLNRFEPGEGYDKTSKLARGLFGYMSYDAVQLFESIKLLSARGSSFHIPLVRYRLYQYVIVIDHFKDEIYICENHFTGVESSLQALLTAIKSKDVPAFPFALQDECSSTIDDEQYKQLVMQGIDACKKGEVFQVVISRRYNQQFTGDDFNVYRALRSINPSPYLFYFDYGDYKIAGSSPEAQVIVANHKAIMHPIAGTVLRTGNETEDALQAEALQKNAKENAEHIMLVDLARNDLSKMGQNVTVAKDREVQYFSHVIHLVSEVEANLEEGENPFKILAGTFPAGTLSGAPKYRAMQLIDEWEQQARGFYGGVIGFVGFDGTVNHAILIRSFLSKNNTITLQAGAGVVAASEPDGELKEVENKLGALQKALIKAEKFN